jgi:hypothetical protein
MMADKIWMDVVKKRGFTPWDTAFENRDVFDGKTNGAKR